jgi:hypothetical protein
MQKIINRIDVKLVLTQRPGQIAVGTSGTLVSGVALEANARCLPGETAVSAGISHKLTGSTDPNIWTVKRFPDSNIWNFATIMDGTGGKLYTFAECLKVELSLKGSPQPQP